MKIWKKLQKVDRVHSENACFMSQMSHESMSHESMSQQVGSAVFHKDRACWVPTQNGGQISEAWADWNPRPSAKTGFEDIQILSQGIVLSDFSGFPVEINPFFKALFFGIDLIMHLSVETPIPGKYGALALE